MTVTLTVDLGTPGSAVRDALLAMRDARTMTQCRKVCEAMLKEALQGLVADHANMLLQRGEEQEDDDECDGTGFMRGHFDEEK